MPVWLTGGRLKRVRPGKDFAVNRRTINFNELPDELCGLTIAHLSDPHIGELITPAHLESAVEAINDLHPDMVAATGDFIDFSNRYLPAVCDILSRLSAPLGVWCVLGNHDHLDNAAEVVEAFDAAGLNVLVNRAVRITHHDKAIRLAGIDWAGSDRAINRLVRQTLNSGEPADLGILLAHHPHAFDAACRRGIDLTLSGHTHGGQMVLSNGITKKGSISLAGLSCRYPRGLYSRGDSHLHVSSGVGSWFPLRFRCPAEITLLELQCTY